MANGNRVDEVDNQIQSTDFGSKKGGATDDFEESPPKTGADDDVDLAEVSCEDAVRANPKRLSTAQRRQAEAVIEGLIDAAQLADADGQKKAWEKLRDEIDDRPPQPFDISQEFLPSDVIEHPEFGTGFVVELISPKKMEVLFSHGLKRLACNIDR